jgi:hypothetical protein
MQSEEKNHLRIGELPDLRLIPIGNLRFHEEHDEVRLKMLSKRLDEDGNLKNPPIAGRAKGAQDLIILDGANRVTALDRLGIHHVPVQIVDFDDPHLVIASWHHAVERLGRDHFMDEIRSLHGVMIYENREIDANGRDVRSHLCSLFFREGGVISVMSPDGLQSQVESLKRITGSYLRTSRADRVSYTNPNHLGRNYPDFQTLVVFREFSKEQVLQLISNKQKLPAGITRIILPKRVLGLNTSLELLRSSSSLEEKNIHLNEIIKEKVAEKSIRFYQESTFVFDE